MILKDDPGKRYYTIGEVAELFGVSKSLIRFWESEFSSLTPHKNSKGDRRFTKENLQQLQVIYHLVKEKGYTLAGAKQEIKNSKKRLLEKMAMVQRLEDVKSFLEELKDKF
jgi:DNA-binding transcriptional MerR regulator